MAVRCWLIACLFLILGCSCNQTDPNSLRPATVGLLDHASKKNNDLSDAEIVKLCGELEFESEGWKRAFAELRRRESLEAVAYVLELGSSEDCLKRYYAYNYCSMLQLDDLVSIALKDIDNNDEIVVIPNVNFVPISFYARHYLRSIKHSGGH